MRGRSILRSRHKFQNMAVRVAEVNSAASFARVQLPIVKASGLASIRNPGILDAPEDGIELALANVKRVVVVFKRFGVVKIKGEILVNSNGSEVSHQTVVLKTEDLRKKTRCGLLVTRRHNSVIQGYAHDCLPVSSSPSPH
jgi:hypothetical protein